MVLAHMQTIAYLLPSIQRVLENQATGSELAVRIGRDICMIIVAPTRELAQQIGTQAEELTAFCHGWTIQTLTGSTSLARDKSTLAHQQRVPTIIVATPGRLLDLLQSGKASSTRVSGSRSLMDVVAKTPIIVLDEADLLLQAFRSEVQTILTHFPRVEKRQTMLFSATVPPRLKRLLSSPEGKSILPKDYTFVDCIGDATKQVNQRVEQTCVRLSDMTSYLKGLLTIVREASQDDVCHKVIIFFPTAKLVKFVAEAIQLTLPKSNTRGVQVLSIHSRMSHGARHRASSQFRATDSSQCSILLTSDVSARGVDYGDVSLVVQVSTMQEPRIGLAAPLLTLFYLRPLVRSTKP
jgi:ATP-dependent RNA helicase MSS116, mitochondrial